MLNELSAESRTTLVAVRDANNQTLLHLACQHHVEVPCCFRPACCHTEKHYSLAHMCPFFKSPPPAAGANAAAMGRRVERR